MKLSDVIDLDNLHKYSNVDPSTIIFDNMSNDCIAILDHAKFIAFTDIFNDVNKLEMNDDYDMVFTFSEIIIYIIYSENFIGNLTNGNKMKILFRLLQKDFLNVNLMSFMYVIIIMLLNCMFTIRHT